MAELTVPASDLSSVSKAFELGCDAVYVSFSDFSLGTSTGSFSREDIPRLREIKTKYCKKLYCALDVFFHIPHVKKLDAFLTENDLSFFDAFIISDIGVLETVRKHCAQAKFHLSSFANCLNSASAEMFHKLGFSRVILGHESNLSDIQRICEACPKLEIEVQVGGTMCMSYSGRRLLSTHFENSQASRKDLAIEEEQRKGLFFPIEEKDGFITILSSKELDLSNRVHDLQDFGVSAFRIENSHADCTYLESIVPYFQKSMKNKTEQKQESSCSGFLFTKGPLDV